MFGVYRRGTGTSLRDSFPLNPQGPFQGGETAADIGQVLVVKRYFGTLAPRATPRMTILPASARFVVPASTAAASKLVLFDVMDTIVADPFFRGFHKVAHTRLEQRVWLVRADPRFDGTLRPPSARPVHSAAQDLFDLDSVKDLFAIKCQDSFVAFERGEISEAEHFATYFTDRRPVDGSRVTEYLRSRYA